MGRHTARRRRVDTETDSEVAAFTERHARFSDRVERFLMQFVILGLVGLTLVQTLLVIPAFRRLANVVEALEGIPWSAVAGWGEPPGPEATAVSTSAPRTSAKESASTAATSTAQSGGAADGSLTVMLITRPSAPEARLLVDGKEAGRFGSGSVSVKVRPGQSLTIDGGQYREELRFRVVSARGLSKPAPGAELVTRGNTASLGVVKQ